MSALKRVYKSVYWWLKSFITVVVAALTKASLCIRQSKKKNILTNVMETSNAGAEQKPSQENSNISSVKPPNNGDLINDKAGMKMLACSSGQDLPTVYEYFANGSSLTGLVAANQRFTLNGKEIRIVSGAIHYFRVHPALWRDRLKKLRALGANAVETYVAWNLHEPRKGEYDFGDGQNDLSAFADLRGFLQIAQEEDLLVLLRPGPYICTEWDFGGLPSWLQRDPEMKVRENNTPYLDRVKLYMDQLLPRVADLQFTKGGSIIAVQIENEYGSFSPRHKEYLQFVKDLFDAHGLDESLYFTSDNNFGGNGMEGSLEGVLQTANFQSGPENLFSRLREVQPDKPSMAMEFWSGWFNHWGDGSQAGTTPQHFGQVLESILGTWNGSVNFYMFHGGTNFAFMAGGNNIGEPPYILSDITSYDYDAPLSEAGDYTAKYDVARQLIEQYAIPKLHRPDQPEPSRKVAYPAIQPERYLTYNELISQVPSTAKFTVENAVSMENLPMNGDSGQSFGYIIYRKNLPLSPDVDSVFKGSWPRDVAFLIVDGEPVGVTNDDYWINSIRELPVSVTTAGNHTVDLMVEPLTRVNFGGAGDFIQQKGIAPIHQSKIEVNGQEVTDLEIIAMEFTSAWVRSLTGHTEVQNSSVPLRSPVLIESTLTITDTPGDTFLDMSSWNKGIVFVNGFNIGRYWKIGPQQNLYVPAPLLKTGANTITVFEQVQPHTELVFSDMPNLGAPPTQPSPSS